MRKATLNTIKMFKLLNEAGIQMNLEKERVGTADDSLVGVIMASLLHDLGMSIARDSHEFLSIQIATPFIDRVLDAIHQPDEFNLKGDPLDSYRRIFLAIWLLTNHSLEAGLVLIGDGSDMERDAQKSSYALHKSSPGGYSPHLRFGDQKFAS
jgi:metal-dependent HD superfamily phosphatase/phosphodiesterase